jgi:hypothetical protein
VTATRPRRLPVARWCRAGLLLGALAVAASSPAPAAEGWQPDPKSLEAARHDGEAVWYTTLIVDQIVRPLIK